MTLTLKRQIIEWFKAGDPVEMIRWRIAYSGCTNMEDYFRRIEQGPSAPDIEQIIREFMSGKFKLSPRKP